MANGLNVASSIVDFLKSRGLRPQAGEKFPFFETRGQLFNRLGLGTDLGQFRGTAEQNTALLRNLQQAEKSTGISITSENLFDVAMVAQGGGTAQPVPLQQTPREIPGATPTGGFDRGTTDTTIDPGFNRPIRQGVENIDPGFVRGGTTGPIPNFVPGTQQVPTQLLGDVSGLLPQVPEAGDVAQQALERVQRGATFPLQQEAVGAEKEAIRLSAQRQKESFIQQIASRGLFFSGAKTKGIQTVEADQLSQILGVDRKFALLIAQGLERSAQDIVKEAQKGRQEAIESLEALGFAINPVTGRVEPTLQARQAQAQEQRLTQQQQQQAQQFAISQAGVQARFEATEERLRAQQEVSAAQTAFNQAVTLDQRRVAQANLDIAQRRLAIAEDEAQREAVAAPPPPAQITGPQDLSPLARAVFDRTGKLTDLTPTQRANILPELNAVGFSSVLKAEDAQSLRFVEKEMKDVLNNWKKVPSKCTGNIQGRAPFGAFDPFKCGQDPDVLRFNTSVGVVGQTLANMLENGRLTDSDRLFYAGLIPTRLIENPEAAQAASDEMQRLLKSKLNTDIREMEEDIIDATQTDIDYINSLNLP